MRYLTAVIVASILIFCAGASQTKEGGAGHLTLAALVTSNQAKIIQLSMGMSKSDVIALMGSQTAETRDGIVNNPWKVEAIQGKDSATYEALFYVTRKNPPFTPIRKSLTTVIVLKNGKVISWGEDGLERYR